MYRIISVLLIVPVIGASARDVRQYSIEELLNTVSYSGASFSPDGSKILVSSDKSGIFNAYAIPVDGSEPQALTTSTSESIFAQSFFPHDERFIYTADQGGNELTHVYVQVPDGAVTDLTPGDTLKASFAGWAEDKKTFFVITNERDASFFDLYEVATDGYERTLLFENNTGYNISDVSPDKRYIALQRVETNQKSDVYIHDRQLGTTLKKSHHEGDVVCEPQQFTKDGQNLLCLTDNGHEFLYLVTESLGDHSQEVLEKLNWDVSYARLSETGKFLVVGINNDARTELRVYDAKTGERATLWQQDDAGIASVQFNNDDSAIAFYLHSGRTPGDLYYYRIGAGDAPRRLTTSLPETIDPEDLVEPQVVRFESYDGAVIPGILYKPHQADSGAKLPALVYVHGGPGGQTRAIYTPLIQYLVNHGYVVYGINNRGSSGYGKTFFAMDDLKHGNADLDDCVEAKRMLIDTGYVDPERIGIIGGSYGGYMVCAALAFRPEEFAVGVDIFGVTNWYRTLSSIPAWWEAQRNALYKELGNPETQGDYLKSISPLFHAEKITKPMIVLQGKNDPRVLQVESDEMVEAVRKNGVPVEYVVFEDEGHGFRKKENQITGYTAILKFLEEHLKD